jgi:hypothetical protein
MQQRIKFNNYILILLLEVLSILNPVFNMNENIYLL